MKFIDSFRLLASSHTKLFIRDDLALSMRLQEGARLFGIALVSNEFCRKSGPPTGPRVSILASPLPLAAWGNLLRASISLPPEPGALHKTYSALSAIGLFCRASESTNGLEVPDSYFVAGTKNRYERPNSDNHQLLVPSSLFLFEIPETDPDEAFSALLEERDRVHAQMACFSRSDETTLFEPNGDVHELHLILRKVLAGGTTPQESKVAEKLAKILRLQTGLLNLRVDWISPLDCLTRISRLAREIADARKFSSNHADPLYMSKELVVRRDQGSGELYVDAEPWRSIIWKTHDVIPDEFTFEDLRWEITLAHADSDEKVISWDVFRMEGQLFAEFDLLTPAGGLEQEWHRFAYEQLQSCQANILASFVSARVDGNWVRKRFLATIPLYQRQIDDGSPGAKKKEANALEAAPGANATLSNLQAVLECFRCLQGREEGAEAFTEKFISELNAAKSMLSKLLPSTRAPVMQVRELPGGGGAAFGGNSSPRTDSTLENVHVWHGDLRWYLESNQKSFAENPFFFTSPLDENSYDQFYPYQVSPYSKEPRAESGSSKGEISGSRDLVSEVDSPGPAYPLRRAIAFNIARELRESPRARLALIGAYRTGKSTVLNLVKNELAGRSPGSRGKSHRPRRPGGTRSGPEIIVIQLNMGVITPLLLIPTLLREILEFLSAKSSGVTAGNPAVAVDAMDPRLSYSATPPALGDEVLAELVGHLDTQERRSDGRPSAIWAIHLKKWREVLRVVLQDVASKGRRRFVVILDELGSFSSWEQKEVFPVWRDILESGDFSSLNWLVSASRPIAEASGYEPITNTFQEIRVGELTLDEGLTILDCFSRPPIRLSTSDGKVGTRRIPGEIYPVLTHFARVFILRATGRLPYLLQVTCFHVYRRVTRRNFPIITHDLCIETVERQIVPELSDYFSAQWREVPSNSQRLIMEYLEKFPPEPSDFFAKYLEGDGTNGELPPGVRLTLLRSGLTAGDGPVVVPLVALWLRRTGGIVPPKIVSVSTDQGKRQAT